MYTLVIHNVGRRPTTMRIYGVDGRRRDVQFHHQDDAEEAARIVRSLRQDSAFIDCTVENLPD